MSPLRSHCGALRRRLAPFGGLAALGLLAAGLTACAEAELVSHAAKEIQAKTAPEPAKRPGYYKVGRPYEVEGTWYYPRVDYDYNETGIASWYGPGFHGRATANGEVFDKEELTAAHRTLPMPSMVRVTNLENGRSLVLRVNDRGPFVRGRIIDVSRYASELLGFEGQGTAKVRVQVLEGESRRLAAAAKGQEDDGTTPRAAPTVSVAVAPLASPGKPAPAAGTQSNGAVLSDIQPLASRPTAQAAARADVPQPDGVVTILPERADSLYVQVGAFTYLHNATRLRVRLIPVGRASVDPSIVNGKYFYRVRFGPLASVQEADRLFETLIDRGYKNTRIVVE